MSYWSTRRKVEEYSRVIGKKAKTVPQELILMERQVKDMKSRLAKARADGASEEVLGQIASELAVLEGRYHKSMILFEQS